MNYVLQKANEDRVLRVVRLFQKHHYTTVDAKKYVARVWGKMA